MSTFVDAMANVTQLLFVVLILGKLTGTVECSWWWVMAPLWGPLAFFAVLGILAIALKRWA